MGIHWDFTQVLHVVKLLLKRIAKYMKVREEMWQKHFFYSSKIVKVKSQCVSPFYIKYRVDEFRVTQLKLLTDCLNIV